MLAPRRRTTQCLFDAIIRRRDQLTRQRNAPRKKGCAQILHLIGPCGYSLAWAARTAAFILTGVPALRRSRYSAVAVNKRSEAELTAVSTES